MAEGEFAAGAIRMDGISRVQRIVYAAIRCGVCMDFVALRRLDFREAKPSCFSSNFGCFDGNDVFCHGRFCHGIRYC